MDIKKLIKTLEELQWQFPWDRGWLKPTEIEYLIDLLKKRDSNHLNGDCGSGCLMEGHSLCNHGGTRKE